MIDAHCDALWKMWSKKISFFNREELTVNYHALKNSPIKLQCFAIFIPDNVPQEHKFEVALEMVDLFYSEIIEKCKEIVQIKNKNDLLNLAPNEIGAMLTLEGLDAIGNDLSKLEQLLSQGVRMVGLTWNYKNAVSSGVMDELDTGLSVLGERVVRKLNEENIWIDLAHISYQGFFDTLKLAKHPMVSHANVYSITGHKRNLDDRQINALILKNSWIGLTYVKEFVAEKDSASIDDFLRHMIYLIEHGAAECIGIGSDFDGADYYIQDLTSPENFSSLISRMKELLPLDVCNKIAYENFIRKFPTIE